MNNTNNYWSMRDRRVTRRKVIGTAGVLGAVGLVGVGCGDDDDDSTDSVQGTPESRISTPTTKQPKRGGSLTMRVAADPPNWSVFTASALTVPPVR